MSVKHVFVDGLARLPAFCHATIAGDFIFVSGTLGTKPDSMELVPGGAGPEIKQALLNVRTILNQCGTDLDTLTKVNVYIRDMSEFKAMNEAYIYRRSSAGKDFLGLY